MGRPAVLVIAGSDSSGGAGLARDVRTLETMGADALCAVTAVTAQTDAEVLGVYPVPPDQLRAQIAAALATRPIHAIKIGMLAGRAALEEVAEALRAVPGVPVVLDPVLRASSGGVLLDDPGFEALRTRLFPRVTVLTPNIPEAAALCGEPAPRDDPGRERLVEWAAELLAQGPGAVLLKGGHARGTTVVDLLARRGVDAVWFTGPRLAATRRGTGCALASAIAASLAAGADLEDACRRGREHVRALLEEAQSQGGSGERNGELAVHG